MISITDVMRGTMGNSSYRQCNGYLLRRYETYSQQHCNISATMYMIANTQNIYKFDVENIDNKHWEKSI